MSVPGSERPGSDPMGPDPRLPGVRSLRAPRREPAAGLLLVASPLIDDGPFVGTVVALLEHDEDGSLGVVLNRPTEVAVSEVLPGWEAAVDPWPVGQAEPVLFEGGPVGRDSALAVGVEAARRGGTGVSASPGVAASTGRGTESLPLLRPVRPGWGLVDLDAEPEQAGDRLAALRIYAGYAGWSSGQLEAEVDEGAWWVIECEDPRADLVSADPAGLWAAVVRRQRSSVRLMAHRPTDAARN